MHIIINRGRKGVCFCEVFNVRGSLHRDLTSSDLEIIVSSNLLSFDFSNGVRLYA